MKYTYISKAIHSSLRNRFHRISWDIKLKFLADMLQERRKEVDILRENARLRERNGRYRSIMIYRSFKQKLSFKKKKTRMKIMDPTRSGKSLWAKSGEWRICFVESVLLVDVFKKKHLKPRGYQLASYESTMQSEGNFKKIHSNFEVVRASWWLNQRIWKICARQFGSFPQGSGRGKNSKNVWNEHLAGN